MSQEKKRQRLSFNEKSEIIEKVKAGTSKEFILKKYGICDRTYKRLLTTECDLNNKSKNYEYQDKKSSRTCDNVVLESALIEWFKQTRERGDPISGPIIQEKAQILNRKLNGPQTFKASSGWLRGFKKRHGIRNIRMKGEKLSNDPAGAVEFSQILKAKLESENLKLDNIYNADESGILWRLLMACTLALHLEEVETSGRKQCKDRFTALFCANAAGSHRIPLLVRNLTTKESEYQRSINLESLGVTYTCQNSSWMDRSIFMLWYKDEFIPRVLEHQRTCGITGKVVLLLDNAPSRPSLDELNAINENFEVMYLPPNVTALIQPMDQGLIATTKKLFKKNLLRRLLFSEKPEGAVKFLRECSLRDCFGMLSLAWDSVKSSTLQKAWKPLLGDSFVLNEVPTSANLQDPLSNFDAVVNQPESPTDLISFPYEVCDQLSELLSGPDYSVEKSKEFLLKWFENDHKDDDSGWESLPGSVVVNFGKNVKCEPEIATEIDKNEICDSDSELLSERIYSVEKSREFLGIWFENDHKDDDCGSESLPDSGVVNFVTNVKRAEPEIVTEIEKSEISFKNPDPMEITSSENCGWESLPDSGGVNFVTNDKCEPEIVTEIEKSENFFEYPEPMEITSSEAFDGLMKFKNWLKNRSECLPKHLDYIKELENVITECRKSEISQNKVYLRL